MIFTIVIDMKQILMTFFSLKNSEVKIFMPGSRNRNSVQSNSWIGNLPNFMTFSLSRKSSFSRPTYQCSRPPSPPRLFSYPPATQAGHCEDGFRSPHLPPQRIPVKDYKYQKPVHSRNADVTTSGPVTDILEKRFATKVSVLI